MDKPIPEAVHQVLRDVVRLLMVQGRDARVLANELNSCTPAILHALTAAQQQGQAVACKCGGQVRIVHGQDIRFATSSTATGYRAECSACASVTFTRRTPQAAIEAWNQHHAPQPMQQGGGEVWQPMATAPKNGAGILALLPESNFPVGVRYHDGGWHVAWDGSRLGEFDQPRKWMRIPDEGERTAPPSAPVGVGAEAVPELAEIAGWINGEMQDWLRIGGSETFGDIVSRQLHKWHEEHARRGELLKEALAQQPAAVDEAMVMVQKHDALILADFAKTHGGAMEQLAARRIAALATQQQEPKS